MFSVINIPTFSLKDFGHQLPTPISTFPSVSPDYRSALFPFLLETTLNASWSSAVHVESKKVTWHLISSTEQFPREEPSRPLIQGRSRQAWLSPAPVNSIPNPHSLPHVRQGSSPNFPAHVDLCLFYLLPSIWGNFRKQKETSMLKPPCTSLTSENLLIVKKNSG